MGKFFKWYKDRPEAIFFSFVFSLGSSFLWGPIVISPSEHVQSLAEGFGILLSFFLIATIIYFIIFLVLAFFRGLYMIIEQGS